MKIFANLVYLISQRPVVLIIALFLAIVLFNTTYLSLGTNVPIVIIFIGFCFFLRMKSINANKKNICFVWLSVVILLSTLFSGGEQLRDCFKILITVSFLYFSTSIKIKDSEVKYLSFFICASYLIYAILVFNAMGQETEYYGRAQIRILNSEIPLDPNVVAAVFILPMIISLYNLLYGKCKLLAGLFLVIFAISVIALGSRGATISFIVSSVLLLAKYLFSKAAKLWVKCFSIIAFVIIAVFVFDFISEQDAIFGFDRILDFSGDDASNGRTGVWIERLDLFTYSPMWGYGMNYNMGMTHRGMACHNTFIQLVHYGGVIGFCLFLIPIVSLFKRSTVSKITKLSLFISVFMPVCFIDTLQERTIWNFLIFYSILSMREGAERCLLWNFKNE